MTLTRLNAARQVRQPETRDSSTMRVVQAAQHAHADLHSQVLKARRMIHECSKRDHLSHSPAKTIRIGETNLGVLEALFVITARSEKALCWERVFETYLILCSGLREVILPNETVTRRHINEH